MMATRLATHTMVAMVTTNLFLSQMAMLEASVSASFGKKGGLEERNETYMRKIIKREAAESPK